MSKEGSYWSHNHVVNTKRTILSPFTKKRSHWLMTMNKEMHFLNKNKT